MPKSIVVVHGQPTASHLSRAVRFGDLLFISGTTGRDPSTMELVGADIRSQAARILKVFDEILQQAGASLNDLVKVTCYIADLNDKPDFDEIHVAHFPHDPPARACVQVAALSPGVKIEMEAIAGLPAHAGPEPEFVSATTTTRFREHRP